MSVLRVSLSLIFLALIATVAATQPPEKMPTTDEITKSWGTLSDKYTSLKMTWKQKAHYTGHVGTTLRESIRELQAGAKRGGNPNPVVVNQNEYRHENTFTFLWANGPWRLEKSGLTVLISHPEPVPDHWTLVFNGQETTSLQSPSLLPQHQARIDIDQRRPDIDASIFRRIGNHLLGATNEIVGVFKLDDFQLSAGQAIQGMKTIQAKKIDPMTKDETKYVFVPKLGYAIAELTSGKKEKLYVRYQAEFDPKSKVPFIPTSWKYEVHDDGKLYSSHTNTLESLSLNAPVPDGAFKLTFPPGTLVSDRRAERKPKRYTVPDAKPPEKQ